PNIDKALLERLVIDPIFFYLVMILTVPLSFGFSYMMIKLAKHAEANAKLQPKKASKGAINFSPKWIYVLFVVLIAFQIYLNIAAYYAVLQGMKNYSLFIIGIAMLVFAGMFHLYRYGRALAKAPPTKPVPPTPSKPAAAPAAPKPAPAIPGEKPLAAPPTATTKVGSDHTPQISQQKQASTSATGGKEVSSSDHVKATTVADGPDRVIE